MAWRLGQSVDCFVVRLASSVSLLLGSTLRQTSASLRHCEPLHVCERRVNDFCLQTILVSISDAKAFSNEQSKAGINLFVLVLNKKRNALSPVKKIAIYANTTDCGSACKSACLQKVRVAAH